MFVSSYNTYIHTSAKDKAIQEKDTSLKNSTSSFTLKESETTEVPLVKSLALPVNYVLSNKSFGTKIELERQKQELAHQEGELSKSKELTQEFTSFSRIKKAQTAYQDNSKIFSFFRKAYPAQSQTPTVDKKLSPEIQNIKEKNIRHIMVNTYISNENYYKRTA